MTRITNLDDVQDFAAQRGLQYARDGATLSVGWWLDLRSVTEFALPPGATLSVGWSLDLNHVTEFALKEGATLSVGGSLYLRSVTEFALPPGATLSVGGSLDLCSVTEFALEEGATLSVGGALDLCSVTEFALPPGATLSVGVALYLNHVTEFALPPGATLSVGGPLDLCSVTEFALEEGATLSVGGSLCLRSVTEFALPPGATLSVGGSLYLNHVTEFALPEGATLTGGGLIHTSGGALRWNGCQVRCADGIPVVVTGQPHTVNGVTVTSVRRLACQPTLDQMPQWYLAEADGLTAHGDSVEQALRDIEYKRLRSEDVSDLVAAIRRRGVMTPLEYRALTGACEVGLADGMQAAGIAADVASLPLADVVSLSAGQYGGDRIAELFS